MKFTRRQLAAAALAATPIAASPQTEDLEVTVRDRMKANSTALNAVPVPMATEPAVVFKAT